MDVQLEAARGQLDGSKLLRLPGEQEGQVPRHGVFSRPYQSQQLRGEATDGWTSGGIDGSGRVEASQGVDGVGRKRSSWG